MTLDQLRPVANRLLAPWVRGAKAVGATPNSVSVVAFLLAVGAGVAFYVATPLAYGAGAVLVFLNGWLDLLDGALARELGTDSEAGDLLDHVLDRYADVVVVAGLAAGIARFDLGLAAVTGVLLTSYLGTQAEAVGLDRVYGGLLGRADRLALVGVTGAVSVSVSSVGGYSPVAYLLGLFAVVGHLTAVQRFVSAWRQLA
ncbi:CDP-alcohol phosphatidyltransferase family protein [Halobacterium litoreum]|uniref:CDP-alcohol phosphatidyltransferase family protein n=1 Tax=Halobacterium litoreum TaxID=2039234 RepID=A0ABD5NAV3_9EURY|nr:CDP-alcohol phosphatidyltransferase family protein [Halobacterium litoreum]UHH14762.1 CDP-alcohol phosphatidyltransferase family protein [Halobacterium litoreum]